MSSVIANSGTLVQRDHFATVDLRTALTQLSAVACGFGAKKLMAVVANTINKKRVFQLRRLERKFNARRFELHGPHVRGRS